MLEGKLTEVWPDADIVWMVSRLTGYNPHEMQIIMDTCTIAEIAAAVSIQKYDNSFEHGK